MPADVFFLAGEASGDLQAALLAAELRKRVAGLKAAAIGGRRLREAGAEVVIDSSEWASIGPLSALAKIPYLVLIGLRVERMLRAHAPRLIVAVDFGAFNLRLLQRMRRGGWRGAALYYFPPGAWLDNPGQARAVAAVSDALTPFGHQRDFYRGLGLPVEYFGHPLASVVAPRQPKNASNPPIIAVLPGSRREEVALHLPVLARAAAVMAQRLGAGASIVAASPAREAQIRSLWAACSGPNNAVVTRDEAVSALDRADVAWVASGTAVLEAALRAVPQVPFYKVSALQYRIAQRRMPHIARGPVTLPNLVLGRTAIVELLQDELTPSNLVARTLALLQSEGERNRQLEAYADMRRALGPPDALARIGAFVASRIETLDRAT